MTKREASDIGAEVQAISKAELILNRTLAYQAAIAVHALKEELDLDVEELRLSVSPSIDTPGTYRVICTIETLAAPAPVMVELVVAPEHALVSKKVAASGDR